MKRFLPLIAVLAIVFSLWAAPAAAETYTLDSAHSYILFRIKHLNTGWSYGRFDMATGTIDFNDMHPEKSTVMISVDAKNVSTGVEKRDNHLKSADFFNVEKYTTITFKSTSFKKIGMDLYEVAGDITLLGRTRPATVQVKRTGMGKDPWGNMRIGFETMFEVKRSEFGLDFMMNGLSDEVGLTVSVEAVHK